MIALLLAQPPSAVRGGWQGADPDVHGAFSELGSRGWTHVRRIAALFGLVAVLVILHVTMDTADVQMRSMHVMARQAFALPVLLAAMWYRRRWVLLLCAGLTIFYAGHVVTQWSGTAMEHLTEISEISLLWVLGLAASFLVERERRALVERAMISEGTLVALVMAIDARERNTRLHSLRVRAYALHLGQAMGVRGQPLEDLGRGALLHDIGKIGTPDAILLKPGRLDEDEWQIMRRHPELGAAMIEPVGFLRDARQIVLAHHERFDGTGYPRGLSGADIPLGARIFAMIDALDALTSDRPYHTAMTFETAALILRKDGGTHFDPQVVDAFDAIPAGVWRGLAAEVQERFGHADAGPLGAGPRVTLETILSLGVAQAK